MEIKYIGGDVPWSLPFGDHFNSQQNNRELETIARRYDFEPLYDQRVTSGNSAKWTNAGVVFSNKTIDSGLTSIHHTDFHDDHGHTFCYLCSINQHEHERTKPRDESKRRKLIPYKNPKARLSSSLDRIAQDSSSSSDLISYRFVVRTGTQKNSGTRAQVFLYIYGTEKNWTSIHLQGRTNQNSIDGFPSGSARTFCLKGPDIGQLHHLNVNLVGAHSNKKWFLKEIEITNLNTSITWLCEFNCWLPKTDEQEVNQIKPTVHRPTEFSLSIYILQIRTGEKPFAGTDSNVQIIVRGSASQTHRLPLTSNRANLFEQNQLDTFAIVGWDLGDLLEITVESDRSQVAADWDIKEMIMWRIIPTDDHKQSHVYFPFNTWLGKKVSTLRTKREVYPSTDLRLKGPICYQVSVKTGKVMNAGTDANVFLIIYGKSGRTIIHQLDNRLKNDFERNTTSEFTIMDIDIGEIDRIKIWHDNSGPGSAWFLDSIVIHKKYSTCHTISNVYIQRLDQISQALHRQIREQMKKNFTVHTPSTNEDKHHSASRRSLNSSNGSNDYLGSNRSILRSPTMYDKASLHKKVTWNEQSIGSQDDLLSMDSQRMKSMQNIGEQKRKKEDSLHHHHDAGHFDHQVYWISSHSYTDHKWQIKSIEEVNSFDFDQTTRALLLSDRSVINNKIKTPVRESDDEIYEFQANRWLAKDKEDGKLEVYLTSKLIHKSTLSSHANIDPKKKHLTPPSMHSDAQHKKYDDEKDLHEAKRSSAKDLGPIEKSPRGLTSSDPRLSSSRLSNMSKTPLNDLHTFQRNIDPFSRQQEKSSKINPSMDQLPPSSSLTHPLKSPRNINDRSSPLSSERELLARITGEPSHHPRLTATSSLSSDQRLKSPQNINEREPLNRLPHEPPIYPRSTATATSSSSQYLKSPRNISDLTSPAINERRSLAKISDQPPHYSRSTPALSLSTDQHLKSSHNSNDLINPLVNTRDPFARIPREPSDHTRSTVPSISLSSQHLKSPRSPNELTYSTSEQELLARLTNEPSHHSRLPATSLTSLNQRAKLTHNPNDRLSPSMNERETLAKISVEPPNYPRSGTTSLLSSSQPSKLTRSSNEPVTRTSIEPPLRSKPPVRSNPNLSSQKSPYDQVYSSAYGTAQTDDF